MVELLIIARLIRFESFHTKKYICYQAALPDFIIYFFIYLLFIIVMFSCSWCSDGVKQLSIPRSVADLVLYTLAGDGQQAALKIALT